MLNRVMIFRLSPVKIITFILFTNENKWLVGMKVT